MTSTPRKKGQVVKNGSIQKRGMTVFDAVTVASVHGRLLTLDGDGEARILGHLRPPCTYSLRLQNTWSLVNVLLLE